MDHPSSPRIAIVGAGAVGSFFGGMLARAGHHVVLVARAPHVQAIARQGLRMLLQDGSTHCVAVAASTELDVVRDCELVLCCVKSRDTAEVARSLAPLLTPRALVLSLQNGVENPALLARELARPVLPVAVYVAVAMAEPGLVRHFGRGELVLGPRTPEEAADGKLRARLLQLVEVFDAAGIPLRISECVMDDLWSKLLVNCAFNAISALSRQPYGRMVEQEPIRALQQAVVQEVLEVARACGRHIDPLQAGEAVQAIGRSMAGQLSSTAQDLMRGRPTEIDDLNGCIVRLGAAHGIATPANQALHALVKLAEGAATAG